MGEACAPFPAFCRLVGPRLPVTRHKVPWTATGRRAAICNPSNLLSGVLATLAGPAVVPPPSRLANAKKLRRCLPASPAEDLAFILALWKPTEPVPFVGLYTLRPFGSTLCLPRAVYWAIFIKPSIFPQGFLQLYSQLGRQDKFSFYVAEISL